VCELRLDTAEKNLLDERLKSSALVGQRNAAVHAMRGSFWSGLKHAARWFFLGAAVGAIAAQH
jgi:hypothetical protein